MTPQSKTARAQKSDPRRPWLNDPVVGQAQPQAKPWANDPIVGQTPAPQPKPRANLSEIDAIIEEAAAAIPGGYEAWAAKPADPQRMAALGYTPDPLAKSGYSRPRAPQAPIVDSGQTTNLFTDAMRMLEAPIAGLTGGASGGGLEGWAKTTTQNPLLGATEAVNFISPVDEAGRAYLGLRDTGAGLIEGDMGKAAQGAQQFVTEGSMAGIQAIPGTMTYKGLTGPVRRTPTTLAEAQRGASLYSVPGKAPLPAEPSIRQTGKTLAAVAVPGRPIRPQAMQAIGRILLASNVPADRVRSGMAKVVKSLQTGMGGPEIGSARPPTIAQLIEREFAQEFPEVTQNIRTVLLERRLANKPKDASPTIIRDAAQEMRGSQVSFLDESASRNLGGNSRLATSADVEANLRQIGEEGYAPIVYQRAEPQRARQIQDVLNGPGMNELGRPLRQIAAGEGVDIDVMIAQRPIQAAHWMQHKARLLAAENEGTALGNAYNNMRSRILKTIDDLETPDGQTYAQIRARYGDEAGIKDALSAGDRFGAIVNNPDGANRFVEAFERATPEQQAAQLASIRDWAQGKLRRGGEGGTARITELKNIAVLETLERLGPQGKALADDIRAIRDEEQFLGSFYPNAESATARNLLAAGQGADLYSRPGASSLPVNALADAALMGAGLASAPIMTAMRQGPRLYRGIMQPRTATREDMTRVLMSRPRGPTRPQAPQQALPAGQVNPLSAGAPPRPPMNALAPARVEPPPLVMPEAQQIGRWEGPPPQKPQSLLAWLRGQGGIKDRNYMTGDLKSVMGKSNAMPGLLNNQSGKGLDELTRAAFQEGFDVDPEDASTLMRLIEEEFSGNPSYRIGAREEWDVYQEYLAAVRGDLSDPPEQAGFGVNATGLGGAGGAVAGAALAPDANGDGVIDAQERMAGGMGGLATGLVGGGLAGAGANRLLGPRRGVSKAAPARRFRAPDQQTFAGVNAKTADKVALARAQNMEAEGASRDAIWDETGWFKGVDGKWRFEIDDSGAKLTGKESGFLGKSNPASERLLGDGRPVMEHSALYDAYPDLRGAHASISGKGGEYTPVSENNFETIRAGQEDPLSIMLHEAGGHGIQAREGFARGGSMNDDMLPSDMAAHRHMQLSKRSQEILAMPHVIAAQKRLDELKTQWKGRDNIPQDVVDELKAIQNMPEKRELARIKAEATGQLRKASDFGVRNLFTREQLFDGYRRLAGEVEARNVQTRRDFTPEERRARRPWETQDIPDDQQIVRFGSGKAESRPKAGPQKPKR